MFLVGVQWLWNRLDLSVDAVVKYFACGFFICTGTAIVYEWVVSKASQKLVFWVGRLGNEGLILFGENKDHDFVLPNGEHYHNSYVERPFWYLLAMEAFAQLVNSFLVAGMTEEICKYLCFWMVEHPDLELRNKVMLLPSSYVRRETKVTSGSKSGDEAATTTEDTETTGLLSRTDQQTSSSSDREQQQQPIFAPTASLVSVAEATTVAMVTVALGFACAENLLYIFVYTAPVLSDEISTLYVRCLFPIHPICAALQSIGVCRRDLEKDKSVGIGKILFPAWLLHGCFDFALMAYAPIKNILERHSRETATAAPTGSPGFVVPGGDETVDADQGVPWLMYVMAFPFIAMMWFLIESFYQRERLDQLDKENWIKRRRESNANSRSVEDIYLK